MKKQKILIAEGFWYDDETYVSAGFYDFVENGINGYEMIKVNDEWLDLADFDAIAWVEIQDVQ